MAFTRPLVDPLPRPLGARCTKPGAAKLSSRPTMSGRALQEDFFELVDVRLKEITLILAAGGPKNASTFFGRAGGRRLLN